MIPYLGLIPVESRAESNCIKSYIIYKQRENREREREQIQKKTWLFLLLLNRFHIFKVFQQNCKYIKNAFVNFYQRRTTCSV